MLISGAVGPGDHESESSSIWLASILGGAPRRLRGDAFGAMISPDDSRIVFTSDRDLWLSDAEGHDPREFLTAGDTESLDSPNWSWNGDRIVYTKQIRGNVRSRSRIESCDPDACEPTVLVDQKRLTGSYLMLEDRMIYAVREPRPRQRDVNLWQVALDPGSGRPRGTPRRLTDWVDFTFGELSATRDGKKFAFYNHRGQSDVFVGEFAEEGRSLTRVRRLTLDDRPDWPAAWTPDGRAVIFGSSRNGTDDIFRQDIGERTAEELAQGKGFQNSARLTPDGEWFLYWDGEERDEGEEPAATKRLLRKPIAGGPTELVLEAGAGARFRCASAPATLCLLFVGDFDARRLTVSKLDPADGSTEELWQIEIDITLDPHFELSPDGTTIAFVGDQKDVGDTTIRLRSAASGELTGEIEADGLAGFWFTHVAWSPDGRGFYLSAESPRGVALLHVEPNGDAHLLAEDQTGAYFTPLPSPDGRQLAFGKLTSDTNAWMLEGL